MPYYIKRKGGKVGDGDEAPNDRGKRQKQTVQRPSLSRAVRKLDKVFSLYIRLRDSKPYGYKAFRCISCGQVKAFEYADCGHYYSRTHMATRFDEDNCHAECSYCNRFRADHMIGYRRNILQKIGEQRLALLDVRSRSKRKWAVFEIEALCKHYTRLVEQMKADHSVVVGK